MTEDSGPQYRRIIDTLVHECRAGQGMIQPRWICDSVWNRAALEDPESLPEEPKRNGLLARLGEGDRELIASMLEETFQGGVFIARRVLHDEELAPFDDGYDGIPFNDFIGRLDGWDWPR